MTTAPRSARWRDYWMVVCVCLGGAFLLPSPSARAQVVVSRPIDRATVRLIGVSGMEPVQGRTGHAQRTVYTPELSHGSGVLIEPALIATAAHVVNDLDLLFVRFVGDRRIHGGVVVAMDEANDVAIVRIEPVQEQAFPLPQTLPSLTPGEILHTTGYPLDAMQNNPAAASGALSRQTNDGLLQLALALNPGNSGGPVLNGNDQLVGIVSARGRLDRGVQGIALAVPISHVVSLRAQVTPGTIPRVPSSIDWLFSDETEVNNTHMAGQAVLAAAAAHREWRKMLARLLEFRVSEPWQLPPDVQEEVARRERRARGGIAFAIEHDVGIRDAYHLRELEAQLNGFNPQHTQHVAAQSANTSTTLAPTHLASTESAAGVGEPSASSGSPRIYGRRPRLEVRSPLSEYTSYRRLSLRLGAATGIDAYGFTVGMGVNVVQTSYFDFFIGFDLSAGYWLDVCGERCDLEDSTYIEFHGGPGIRLHGRTARTPYLSLSWHPGYMWVDTIHSTFTLAGFQTLGGYLFGRVGIEVGYALLHGGSFNYSGFFRSGDATLVHHRFHVGVVIRL